MSLSVDRRKRYGKVAAQGNIDQTENTDQTEKSENQN
jgi:hypothetical protein